METIVAPTGIKLVYTTDRMPGYRRVRKGRGFAFYLPEGKKLEDPVERKRLLSLAVPPAYVDVWICLLSNGHLQATGIDARGRKQYRYHPAWHDSAADKKFSLLPEFAATLPRIRAAMRKELAQPELARGRVIAGIVSLLDMTGYRIGNTKYEKDNRTFGLSSLLNHHLREQDGQLKLKFRGKSGQRHEAEISDPRLAKLVAELQELPGQHLFRYEDEAGEGHDIGSGDVNDWLKEVSGGEFTAKHFRTWKASVLCARELAAHEPPKTVTEVRSRLLDAVKLTSARLNHTPATCRKYYIHPGLAPAFESGSLHRIMHSPPPRLRKSDGTALLHADERRLYRIITT